MIGNGYIPPPIDLEETLKNYYTVSQVNNIVDNYWQELYPVGTIYSDKNNDPNIIFGGTWELVENELSDNELLNAYFGTSGLSVTDIDGQKWLTLVSHHVNSGSRVFSSVAEALNCSTAGKISRLYLLQREHEIFKNNQGEYEFKLEYPELGINLKNQWRQTSNPLETCQSVDNYSPISISWSGDYFGGMSRQNANINTKDSCLLSGCQYTWWWYAVCSYTNYNNAIPGPNDIEITGYTNFSVRVFGLENSSALDNHYNLLTQLGTKFWKRTA